MKRSHWSAAGFTLLLALGAAPQAFAETPAAKEPPKFFGIFATTVGTWSEYAVTETEGGRSPPCATPSSARKETPGGTR